MSQSLLAKPIQGGPFGAGQYELASMSLVDRGLHRVQYLVIQRSAGLVVSVAADKQEALAGARRVIITAGGPAANDERTPAQLGLWRDEEMPAVPPSAYTSPAVHVSRRRREIFERTHGCCFYCSCSLVLTGKWHVEHQMPRALGGTDRQLNLVAACVKCNLAKGDRTALEFVATQGSERRQQERPALREKANENP